MLETDLIVGNMSNRFTYTHTQADRNINSVESEGKYD